MKPEQPSRQTEPVASKSSPDRFDSSRLFNGREEILIIHGGETYRLRRTRQGKLILTK